MATQEITLKITANAAQATAALRQVERSATGLSGVVGKDLSNALAVVSPRLSSLTSTATAAAGSMATLAGGAVIGAAALGAMLVGAIALAKGIFDLAKSTSDYGSKIFDAAQKTNFTVETLSGLDIILRTTGGSLESLIPSLGIFQTNMVKARETGSAMSKTFKELNIDTTNQEKAFRQAITALAALGETETQTAKAKELFGRASKDVLGIIKATPAGLDAELKKLEEMGLLLTGPMAAAADAFGDQLEILNIQFAALGRTIGFEVIPVLTIFMQDLSRALTGSAESWRGWAEVVKTSVAGALAIVEGFVIWVKTHGHVTLGVAIDASFHGLLDRAEQLTGVQTAIAAAQQASRLARRGGGAVGGGGGGARRDTRLQDATRDAGLAEREALLITAEAISENKRAFDEGARDIEDFTRRAIEFNEDQLNATIDRITAESNALDEALARKLIKQGEYEVKQRELDIQAAKAHQENKDFAFKEEQDRDRKISEARIAAKKREVDIAEELDAQEIKRIDARIDDNLLSVSEGERQVAAIVEAGFKRRRALLIEEQDAYSTSAERRADITAEIIRQDNARAFSAEEAARRIAKAQFDEQNAGAAGATRPRRANDPNEFIGLNPFNEAIRLANENFGTGTLNAQLFTAALQGVDLAAQATAQAVGEVARAFVLYGTTGTSFRKVAAEIIASIAQQAIAQAAYNLASGLAMSALFWFTGNPKFATAATFHYLAAAAYGAVGAVTAVAGRLVAGNAFQTASGGGGGAGERTGGPEERRPALQPVDINRRGAAPQTITQTLEFKVKGDAVVDKFVQDYRLNGLTRVIISSDGQG